ncbi:MAG: N-acetylmuramoyl-L-alanine amidase [Chthoniobacter sp.]|nr:N-acetylmuramoyl-L-alanine amidase [Chthoniobacter sp.]
MSRTLLHIFVVFSLLATAGAAEWTLHKVGGRDFVTLENLAEFYNLGAVRRANNDFTVAIGNRSLRGAVGSVEFYINGLKFNLSYPIAEVDGKPVVSRMDLTKVIEPVLRPSKIKGAEKVDTIVLDAGHGGHDRGALSPYGCEADFTLDTVRRTQALLVQAGFKVVLTRSNDTFIGLGERTRIANQYANALFISVHFNSGGAGTGLETYTLAPRGVPSMMADGPRVSDLDQCAGNGNDAQNMALATATHASLVVRSRMFDRGIKRARFVVIRDITIPGVLIEGGFLSNLYDAKLVAMPAYRQQMASCILQAVQNYRRAVGTQIADVAARAGESNRVEVPRIRPSATQNVGEPVVVIPTTPATN